MSGFLMASYMAHRQQAGQENAIIATKKKIISVNGGYHV